MAARRQSAVATPSRVLGTSRCVGSCYVAELLRRVAVAQQGGVEDDFRSGWENHCGGVPDAVVTVRWRRAKRRPGTSHLNRRETCALWSQWDDWEPHIE